MSTNPIGKGTINVTVNMPQRLKGDLEKLAKKSGRKLGSYVRALLEDYADGEATVGKPEVTKTPKGRSAARES
jgi:hypothetical protein